MKGREAEREKQRERERFFTWWFAPQKVLTARDAPGRSQELGIPSEPPKWVAGFQAFGLSSDAFPGTIAGSRMRI